MAKTIKTLANILAGVAIGAAIGYLLATDKEKREADLNLVKDKLNDLKSKFSKQAQDFEEEIYNS